MKNNIIYNYLTKILLAIDVIYEWELSSFNLTMDIWYQTLLKQKYN
jgi:hypothetical protein